MDTKKYSLFSRLIIQVLLKKFSKIAITFLELKIIGANITNKPQEA